MSKRQPIILSKEESEIYFPKLTKAQQKRKEINYECHRLSEQLNNFKSDMEKKLHLKAEKGWRGWDDFHYTAEQIVKQIETHFERLKKGEAQEIDIANLCYFLWNQRRLGRVPKKLNLQSTPVNRE